jgi:hypothetical protein
MQPQILSEEPLHSWPELSDRYYRGGSFQLTIRHGIYNRLDIYQDTAAVQPFDGDRPDNGTRTTYIILESATTVDEANKTTDEQVRILPAQGSSYGSEEAHTYKFIDHSSNPKYSGTPEEYSAATELRVVTIRNPARITMLTMPLSVEVGKSADAAWAVVDAKRVQVLLDQSVVEDRNATVTPTSGWHGAVSLNPQRSGTVRVTVRAWDPFGVMVEESQTSLAVQPRTYRGTFLHPTDCETAATQYTDQGLNYSCGLSGREGSLGWDLYTWPP